MSVRVTEKVEIFFDLSAVNNEFLTFDDTTYGKIAASAGTAAGTEYGMTGDLAVDVTDYVMGYSLSRGRSRELDQIVAGNASIRLKNYDGRFLPFEFSDELRESETGDVLLEDGTGDELRVDRDVPYGEDNLVPGKRCRITSATQVVFDGTVEVWDLMYRADRSVETSVSAVDGLSILARKYLTAHTPTDTSPGTALNTMLDRTEVNWPASRSIGSGVSVLGSTIAVTDGTNALTYAQTIAKSDLGRVFADRNNILTFRDRDNLTSGTSTVTFDDQGVGVQFTGAALSMGAELLYTDVAVGGTLVQGGTTSVLDFDATARTNYGIRRLEYSGLLLGSTAAQADSQATLLAGTLLGYYKDPQARIASLEVSLDALGAANQSAVTALELGDRVSVRWTPRGSSEQIANDYIVEGIAHSADVNRHDVSVQLSPVLTAI